MWQLQSCHDQEVGAGAQRARGGPGAAPGPGGGSSSHEVRGGSGAVLSQEPGPRGTWRLRSSPEPGIESRSHGTRGHARPS
jgi:hypothetical protein